MASPKDAQLERPQTLKDAAYQQIRDRILSGELKKGTLYSARHFADLLGVSRTPVREALLRLTNENFLVCHNVQGFTLREFTQREIQDVFETRQLIECHIAAGVAGRLTDQQRDELEAHLARMRERADDPAGFLEADKRFHLVLIESYGNRHFADILADIRSQIALFGLEALGHSGRTEEVLAEHRRILDALRNESPSEAEEAMRDHLARTESYLFKADGGDEDQ